MRKSLFVTAAIIGLSAYGTVDAQICNPVMPPCCPVPCPVMDASSIADITAALKTGAQYAQQAQQLASTTKVLQGAFQHGIALPSFSSVLSPSLRLPALNSAGSSLDSYWQTPASGTALKAQNATYAATGRDASLSAFGAALYLPASLNSELAPSINQTLTALTTVTNFADGHSAARYTNILPIMGGAQAGTPLSALVALQASQVSASGNYASTVNSSTAGTSSSSVAPAAVAPVAVQQQTLAQLEQQVSVLIAFNNARVSAAALASAIQPGDGSTAQATANLSSASSNLTAIAASMFTNGSAATAAIEQFLVGHDPTTYTDNYSKGAAEMAAASALAQAMRANPAAFGTLQSGVSITGTEFSSVAIAYLEAYKNAQFASQISQTVLTAQQQSNQMLASLNSAWGMNLLSAAAEQHQTALASTILSQFTANASLSGLMGYGQYMQMAQAAASDATTPTLLTFQ